MIKEILEFRSISKGLSTTHSMSFKEYKSIENWLFKTFHGFTIEVKGRAKLTSKAEIIEITIPL